MIRRFDLLTRIGHQASFTRFAPPYLSLAMAAFVGKMCCMKIIRKSKSVTLNQARRERLLNRRRTMFIEQLESRLAMAGYTTEWRSLDLSLTGSYVGKNPGTYVVGNPGSLRPYLDVFHGSINASGTMVYSSNTSGSGRLPFGNSPGSGHDNFWEFYAYQMVGDMVITDNAGTIRGGATKERQLDNSSIRYYNPRTPGGNIKAAYKGMPPGLSGTWSPETGAASLVYGDDFIFNGTVTPAITSATTIDINDATLKAGYSCISVEVNVTGALAKAPHTTEIGKVKAVWLNADGDEIGTIFEEPVFWNTGTIKYDSSANAPPDRS